MANPRKFSEKIALHNQKQAEETAAFEKIMREVSDATNKPEEAPLVSQYTMSGGRSGGMSPSPRSPGQRGRASSSVGPMRRPADRKHDTSPYGSNVYLSPPPDSNWRRTNSDSALHQSCGEQQSTAPPLSPHHPLHSHAHPHMPHQNHRRAANIHLDVLATFGMTPSNRPRSSCEIPRIPNNNNVYESGGDGGGGGGGVGGGGLGCGELQVPGGSLPDLTSVHFPPPHYLPLRTSPDYHHSANMSPLDHSWLVSSYQPQCSPPSQYSSTSNIPSPTMVHSPGSPVESPQTDYSNLHQVLLQPFEQITMLDPPTSSYNTTYINHSSPHSPQTTNTQHTYSRSSTSPGIHTQTHTYPSSGEGRARDPVAGGFPLASPSPATPATPATPASIPDIILTDYSGELDASIFGGEEAQLRAGLDLDDLSLLEEPSALLPDSSVEHEFRMDRIDRML
ncbi:CREB-regulated transcription coactivator 3 isoform X4 [Pieris rapae]|uniref:CREB-regulated transcription coactivator 3 isoform X4 n=1 Tax=Pieris rapae TaxID=64459 RepID=UPI001E27F3DE|nr:CREB-regulated transcription coactivator 3 isoform X4 [Pieris rapae]